MTVQPAPGVQSLLQVVQTCLAAFVAWTLAFAFFLDISVQGGKVHEVIPMQSTNPEGTTQRTATTPGNFTPYSFRIVCGFFNVPH